LLGSPKRGLNDPQGEAAAYRETSSLPEGERRERGERKSRHEHFFTSTRGKRDLSGFGENQDGTQGTGNWRNDVARPWKEKREGERRRKSPYRPVKGKKGLGTQPGRGGGSSGGGENQVEQPS